jgi:hypothetical protein
MILFRASTRLFVGATLVLGSWLVISAEPASAMPMPALQASHASVVEPAGAYWRRRHYPPVYPYYYSPGRPGGWSFYFGFVPYARGNYEIQALQREYPQTNWPPSLTYRPYPYR